MEFLFFFPVVTHDSASKESKRKLAEAYELNKKLNGIVSNEALQILRRKLEDDESQKSKSKRQKQKLIGWPKIYCHLGLKGLWYYKVTSSEFTPSVPHLTYDSSWLILLEPVTSEYA